MSLIKDENDGIKRLLNEFQIWRTIINNHAKQKKFSQVVRSTENARKASVCCDGRAPEKSPQRAMEEVITNGQQVSFIHLLLRLERKICENIVGKQKQWFQFLVIVEFLY